MAEEPTPEELRGRALAALERAKQVVAGMRLGARRAFILELTGTPKAGKSSTLSTLQAFLKSAGFKVSVLEERAAECPLAMKGHFFFNVWTMATMLADVLANLETDADLLLLDRGFLDALIWLELQVSRHQVSEEERRVFTEFVLLPRWRDLVDHTVIMTASPPKALEREDRGTLIPRRGTLMNEAALAEFNTAVTRTLERHGQSFAHSVIDTTSATSAKDSTLRVLDRVIPVLEAWANPEIYVIRRDGLSALFGERTYLDMDLDVALGKLSSLAFKADRASASKDPDLIQLVVGGIHVRDDGQILVFRRDQSDAKAASYGKTIRWKGCHVQTASLNHEDLAKALTTRLRQDLHLEVELQPRILGLAAPVDVAGDVARSKHKHLGIMFQVVLAEHVAQTLHEKTFHRSGRAYPIKGQFKLQETIIGEADDLDLEPWSRHFITNWKIHA